ncbi:MAG: phosphotransferase family protein [Acidothermaceae bacterium]
MESLTKRRLDPVAIAAAVQRAFGDVQISHIDELTEGMFNAVYRIGLESGQLVVMKSSPPAAVSLLTYERDIMRTEAAFYDLASSANVPVPQVLGRDFTRFHLDGDVLFLSFLDGDGWHRSHDELDDGDERRLRRDLGRIMRRLHRVQGHEFGYFQPATARASTWRQAFTRMVDDVLADGTRFEVMLPVDTTEIRMAIVRHEVLLDDVKVPSLVHFDVWEGNILLATRAGRREISGLIDGERAMWADPIADFVSAAIFGDIADDDDFLEGYGDGSGTEGKPLSITPEIAIRLAMYKAYLDLIILVEAAPRGYDDGAHADVLQLAADDLHRSLAVLAKSPSNSS